MTQEGFKRKLPVILSAYLVCYSLLMGDDVDKNVRMFSISETHLS